ncbi:MAG: VOC family protein [Deltaproteobacteria bacterium]|nr:VOC family protein [Deltaproteobacteria bacterium]
MNNTGSKPAYISHVLYRTRQMDAMVRWYEAVLQAKVSYRNDMVAFLSFDDEHHRLALAQTEAAVERPPAQAGHVCFGFADFGGLVQTYERLKQEEGILPERPVNHGMTTSLYYRDPDGNGVELAVDNFPTKAEGMAVISGKDMEYLGRPPFGFAFDPDDLVRLYHTGASHGELARIGMPKDVVLSAGASG